MAKRIEWAESKSADWKLCTVVNEQGVTLTEVSANRKEKNGTDNSVWFDLLIPGATVEGNLWQSPSSGKWALYPPKPQAPARGSGAITKAMEKKEASIERFQASKEDSIRMSSTARMATDMTVSRMQGKSASIEEYQLEWNMWRKYFLEQWDNYEIADPTV